VDEDVVLPEDDPTCDGVDDDNDQRFDEDYVPVACGVGACAATSACVEGAVQPCTPGIPAPSDANCDGVDDNCDGTPDSQYAPKDCGVGVCELTAIPSRCDDGVEVACVPGNPRSPVDDNGDGFDDDCDGVNDEDFVPGGPDTNCDDLDNDNDGSTDEGYVPLACGVGACASASECVEGVEVPCQPGLPAQDDAVCDGVDADCDGAADEDYQPQSCGVGACVAQSACDDGEEIACEPLEPIAVNDDDCDGLDDDCSGAADEDYTPRGCGVGACADDAIPTMCVDGFETDCLPGEPAANDATENQTDDDCDGVVDEDVPDADCDGVDEDNDGNADEDFVPVNCGRGACERSSACIDGAFVACTPAQAAPDDATCDDIDDDCDGGTDEDFEPGTCGVGACQAFEQCVGGAVGCITNPPLGPTDATCDDVDDDCSGAADEDYAVVAQCGQGVCAASATPSACNGGVETPCTPGQPLAAVDVTPDGQDDDCDGNIDEDVGPGVDENCNGIDEDFDEAIDEGYVPVPCGVGACAAFSTCVNGVEQACVPGQPNANDALCDGIDEDCDASTDEDYFPVSCGVGACVSQSACVDGAEQACEPELPIAVNDDDCDGLDDDCSGASDEDYTPIAECGVGVCAMQATPSSCNAGVETPCEPGMPLAPNDATGDGMDDDCDGFVDEDAAPDDDSQCDGVDSDNDGRTDEGYVVVNCGQGACARASSCVGGVETFCTPGVPAADDPTCDAIDEDCDGAIDEDWVAGTCGEGACQAQEQCVNGAVGCITNPPLGPNDATCDNVDDDCDTRVDEDYLVVDMCGVGVCAIQGVIPSSCVNGVESACQPGQPLAQTDATADGQDDDCDGNIDEDAGAADDATCDGQDDDNDGRTDEDYVVVTCGVGSCARSSACNAGVETFCTPGIPAADDATCDGQDDDCDASTDEDYAVVNCGVGACANTSSCDEGVETACAPLDPIAVNDDDCDGNDDDCSGIADEDYQPITRCGLGVCADGAIPSSCFGGVESPCEPGMPLAPDDSIADGQDEDCDGLIDEDAGGGGGDPTCDGVDDDNDGRTDEDYVIQSCGAGACQRQSSCNNGVETFCTPGIPAADDSVCDGIDEDCDEIVDEDYDTVSCGQGACANTSSCDEGVETPCEPLDPIAVNDDDCDGNDDDCSGNADEDYQPIAECGVGVCAIQGVIPSSCFNGVETPCTPGQPLAPNDATPDGMDDDCDGNIDEDAGGGGGGDPTCDGFDDDNDGRTDEDYMVVNCGQGGCARQSACNNGVETFCTPGIPAADDATCDGIDDDCDLNTDEDYDVVGCGQGACAAQSACNNGVETPCQPLAPPAPTDTTCDGVDDDCSGFADEDYQSVFQCGLGVCRDAAFPSSCFGGVETPCEPGMPLAPNDAIPDGQDEDCDGLIDEDAGGGGGGNEQQCDGQDNDNDGQIDEDYFVQNCGVGACARQSACNAGVETFCTPGQPAADDATCDGIDDDCDTRIDEDWQAQSCGQGACQAQSLCLNGVEQACQPGNPPSPTDATCDGIDDDCSGFADEDYQAVFQCGLGVCADGAFPSSCFDGVETPCEPGMPLAPNDAIQDGMDEDCDGLIDEDAGGPGGGGGDPTCDGFDDDNDGNTDEDYLVVQCGQGACARSSSCNNGIETFCTPGLPAADDATCDNIDDDCDLSTDEDYQVQTCGQGACQAQSACVNGLEQACQPGQPLAPTDTTCNGIDEDCSGFADEDYQSVFQCGLGVCRDAAFPSSCFDGVETPCEPGMPLAPNDAIPDGQDEDCDGRIDEDAGGGGGGGDPTCDGVDDDNDGNTASARASRSPRATTASRPSARPASPRPTTTPATAPTTTVTERPTRITPP
jgi:hypothetical protein